MASIQVLEISSTQIENLPDDITVGIRGVNPTLIPQMMHFLSCKIFGQIGEVLLKTYFNRLLIGGKLLGRILLWACRTISLQGRS